MPKARNSSLSTAWYSARPSPSLAASGGPAPHSSTRPPSRANLPRKPWSAPGQRHISSVFPISSTHFILVVDSKGVAYAIGLAGLSVIPLQQGGATSKPQITGGSRGIVNASDGSTNFGPGAFISVNGVSLAETAVSEQIPLPTVMGGTCVTFSDVPLPLLQTSTGQITAQVPDNLRPGLYVAQVRSLANATQSDPVVITVQRSQ